MATKEEKSENRVSFVTQRAPIDARGRALYAVTRSILRALIDQLSISTLTALNTPAAEVKLRQLAIVSRLQRDKGMRGDGLEWAVHEAIAGSEPSVVEPLLEAMQKASPRSFRDVTSPTSLLFGQERAKYNGFLDAAVSSASEGAVLLPDGRGHPPTFENWVPIAAQGESAEPLLGPRLRKVWQTDLFVSDENRHRHLAVTIKSNVRLLTGGPGLRIGVVPVHSRFAPGVRRVETKKGDPLWVVSLADRDGFMDLYDDAYAAVANSIMTLGQHDHEKYWAQPTAAARQIEEQLIKYGDELVSDIVEALDEQAQQDLVDVDTHLVSVSAPEWLSLGMPSNATRLGPKPSFKPLD